MFNGSIRVLIVDDRPEMRRLLVLCLAGFGMENVREAENAREAWRQAMIERIDLVISDWSMPGGSGLDLLRNVRSNPQTKETPFLMVTGHHESERRTAALEEGADAFLAKPFKVRKLREVLEDLSKQYPDKF